MDPGAIKEFLARPFAGVILTGGPFAGKTGRLAGLLDANPPRFAARLDGDIQLVVVGCDDFEADPLRAAEAVFAPRLLDLMAALPPGVKVTLERSP